MSGREQPEWKTTIFKGERDGFIVGVMPEEYVVNKGIGWILYGGKDVREGSRKYAFFLQYLEEDKTIRVIAGCRFYTLEAAWGHWGGRRYHNKRNGKMALALITLMLLKAQAYGLCDRYRTHTIRTRYKIPVLKIPERVR